MFIVVDLCVFDVVIGCVVLGVIEEGCQDYSLLLQMLLVYYVDGGSVDLVLCSGVIIFVYGGCVGLLCLYEFDVLCYFGLCYWLWLQLCYVDGVCMMWVMLQEVWVVEIVVMLCCFWQQVVDVVLVDVGINFGGDDSGDIFVCLFIDQLVCLVMLQMSVFGIGVDYLQEQFE